MELQRLCMFISQHVNMTKTSMVKSAATLQRARERKPSRRKPRAAAALPQSYKAPSRKGKRPVTAYLSPNCQRGLRLIQARNDDSLQDPIAEALNELFAKHDVPTVSK
jgi:hypothetical protein